MDDSNELEAKNPKHQHLVHVFAEKTGFCCGDCLDAGRGYVSLASQDECDECHGDDEAERHPRQGRRKGAECDTCLGRLVSDGGAIVCDMRCEAAQS